jgi:hypothetical protein
MNREAPILLEAIKHHQQQYPDVFAVEVEKVVKDTYGEVAVCKIAHSQKLIAHVAEEDRDLTYRNEAELMSQRCHERTHALQQAKRTGWLFNHLVGAGKQSRRHREAERSSSLEVDQ